MPELRKVACPTCAKRVEWSPQNPWRPFCCERCKLIDLGEWASEKYRVPSVEDHDDPQDADPGEPPARGTDR